MTFRRRPTRRELIKERARLRLENHNLRERIIGMSFEKDGAVAIFAASKLMNVITKAVEAELGHG